MNVTMDNYYPMKRKAEDERDDSRNGDINAKRPYMYQDMHYSTMMPPAQNLQGGGWPPNPMSMNSNRGSAGGYRGTATWKTCVRGGGTTSRGNRGYFRGNKPSPGRYDPSVLASYSSGPYQYPAYYYPPPWPQGGYESMEPDLSCLASVPPPPPGTPMTGVQQQMSPQQPQPQQQQQASQQQNQQQNQHQQQQPKQQKQQNQGQDEIKSISIDESGLEEFEFTKAKTSKRRPMSQSYPSRPWNKEAAEKALAVENEYLKGLKGQSLIIRFPDPELSKEIVKKFHPGILNVRFQVPCGPRFCFVQLADDISPDDMIKDLSDVKFGAGTLKVEKKIVKDEDTLSPEAIDPCTLYVGNLPANVNIQTVKEKFSTAYRFDFGFAQKMKFTRYAFVRFNTVETAINAFIETHDLILDSRSIIVRFRRQRGPAAEPATSEASNATTPAVAQPEGSLKPPVLSTAASSSPSPRASTSSTPKAAAKKEKAKPEDKESEADAHKTIAKMEKLEEEEEDDSEEEEEDDDDDEDLHPHLLASTVFDYDPSYV